VEEVQIALDGWEHMCCGEPRTVGDETTITVARTSDGSLVEVRHDYTGGRRKIAVTNLRGRVKAIMASSAIEEHRGGVSYEVVGFGPPVAYQSTQAAEEDFGSADRFVFTLETDDPLPTETWYDEPTSD
jgi:hypothetical protein